MWPTASRREAEAAHLPHAHWAAARAHWSQADALWHQPHSSRCPSAMAVDGSPHQARFCFPVFLSKKCLHLNWTLKPKTCGWAFPPALKTKAESHPRAAAALVAAGWWPPAASMEGSTSMGAPQALWHAAAGWLSWSSRRSSLTGWGNVSHPLRDCAPICTPLGDGMHSPPTGWPPGRNLRVPRHSWSCPHSQHFLRGSSLSFIGPRSLDLPMVFVFAWKADRTTAF